MFCESDADTHLGVGWLEGKMWGSGAKLLPGECGSAPAPVSVCSPQGALSEQCIPSQEVDLRACAVG